MTSNPSWAFLQHSTDKRKDNACACSLESGSHRAPNRVLLLMLSLKDVSELLYPFLLHLPTQTCVHECTRAHLRPRGCNQGNVLANLLCLLQPQRRLSNDALQQLHTHRTHSHTMSTLLCCCSQWYTDSEEKQSCVPVPFTAYIKWRIMCILVCIMVMF